MLAQPSLEGVSAAVAGPVAAYPARVPLLRAAVAQVGGSLLVFALILAIPDVFDGNTSAMVVALAQGVVAASLARTLGMEPWWLPIHALFVPGLVWMLGLGLSPLYPLSAFCLLASIYWGTSRTRVPLFLSSQSAARAVADLLPRRRSFTFVDLGCGFGGMLERLARDCPAGRYCGIELAPLPFVFAWLRIVLRGGACHVSWGDFLELDLGDYDVVYAYLSPAAMPGLWDKASREMRPGSLLVSNSFHIPGVSPTGTIVLGAANDAKLLLWRM